MHFWPIFETNLKGLGHFGVANFNWTVLSAQAELGAQIWTAFWSISNISEIFEILRGFSIFWSFSGPKLQLDRSRRSEGVDRTDLACCEVYFQSFTKFDQKYVMFIIKCGDNGDTVTLKLYLKYN